MTKLICMALVQQYANNKDSKSPLEKHTLMKYTQAITKKYGPVYTDYWLYFFNRHTPTVPKRSARSTMTKDLQLPESIRLKHSQMSRGRSFFFWRKES